ncbi:FIG003620: Proteophosphoglycan precursor (Fragment) [hydrothermal vent metagenome]|uniref:FIG003620: Proteophosphoglycan n=1 Tax=hydrothermal vent metagenome TaxID=652676 RepID=A0A3B0T2K3_9ZZZZ
MEKQHPQKAGTAPLRGLGLVCPDAERGGPPLHLWDPPYCGEIDIRIAADGIWFHNGTPISRPAMVRLFASIMIGGEEGGYFLITPVEKVGITVDDAPFLAVRMEVQDRGRTSQTVVLTTNVGDEVEVGPEHPLTFVTDTATAGFKPYVLVRGGLKALVGRAITYDLVELAETRTVDGTEMFGVRSGGAFFAMARAGEMQG